MKCEACQADLSAKNVSKIHCGSPTCDWVRCRACGAVNQASDTGYFHSPKKDQSSNG